MVKINNYVNWLTNIKFILNNKSTKWNWIYRETFFHIIPTFNKTYHWFLKTIFLAKLAASTLSLPYLIESSLSLAETIVSNCIGISSRPEPPANYAKWSLVNLLYTLSHLYESLISSRIYLLNHHTIKPISYNK